MAQQSGLLGNLLGQAQNTQSGGLMGGGIFSQPQSRGQRRSKLLTDAISGAGANPYARLGASFGGLLGMAGRAGAEGVGLVDKPEEVQRNEAIKKVQSEVAEQGLDPTANPAEFGDFVAKRFEELGQGDLATKTRLQIQQMMPEKKELPADSRNLQFRAEQAGLKPGTEDYKNFMLTGGEVGEEGERDSTTFYNPETQEYVRGTLDSKGRAFDTEGNELGPQFLEKDYTEDKSKGKQRTVQLPDGDFVRGRELPNGRVVDLEGNEFSEDARVVGLSLAASNQNDLPKATQTALNEEQIGIENYTSLANEAIDLLESNPDANSLVAEGSRIFRNVRSEFDAVMRNFGIDLAEGVTKNDLFDISKYDSEFDRMGLENPALKKLYLSLALSNAQAEAGQTGRALSDKDIERFLQQQGANLKDPEVAAEILKRNAQRMQEAFKRSYRIRTGEKFPNELPSIKQYQGGREDPPGIDRSGSGESKYDLEKYPAADKASQAIKQGNVDDFVLNATDEELNNLPPELEQELFRIYGGGS